MRKGFTLIELLAVIVILAIIALIATPIVLGIIEDTKESAQLRSAEMYLNGVENAVMKKNMNEGGNFRPNECDITEEGNLYCPVEDVLLDIEVDGEKPKDGSITYEEGKIKEVTLIYESGTIVKDVSGNLVYEGSESNSYVSLGNYEHKLPDGTIEVHDTESGTCSKCEQIVETAGFYYTDGSFVSYESLIDGTTVKEKEIVPYAFADNGNIEKVVLPMGFTTIGEYAFVGCWNLKNVIIPKTVKQINGFYACYSIKTLVIPEGVNEVSDSSFAEGGLETVYISSTIKTIGRLAFDRCKITDIYYNGTSEEWNKISLGENWNIDCPEITVHCIDGDITIPANPY